MTKIIGHRGARGLAPENTIKSIEAALAHHVDGVEIDVRVTADGVAVLWHYRRLRSGKKLFIRRHRYETLKRQKPDIATLAEALDAIRGRCPLLVEIKPGVPVEPVVRILRAELASGKKTDISVLSFSQSILKQVHAALPDVPVVVNEKWSSVRARLRMRQLGTNRLQMNQRWLWRGFLHGVRRSGVLMTPYTVNSPAQAAHWKPYIDGIITDYPDRFTKIRNEK